MTLDHEPDNCLFGHICLFFKPVFQLSGSKGPELMLDRLKYRVPNEA